MRGVADGVDGATVERVMRRGRLRAAAVAPALAAALAAPSAPAAVIVVTTLADADGGPACTLRNAIVAANLDGPSGGCPAGGGDDVIDLTGLAGTIELTTALPTIGGSGQAVVVRGPGADVLAISGQDAHGVFSTQEAGSPDTAIEGVTIRDGYGPCVFAEGFLTLRDCRITSCNAELPGQGAAIDGGELGIRTIVERCLIDGNFGGPATRVGGYTGMGVLWVVDSTVSNNAGGLSFPAVEGPGGLNRVYASTIAENAGYNLLVGPDQQVSIDHTILKRGGGRTAVNCQLEGVQFLPPGTPNLFSFASLSDDASCGLIGQGDLEEVDPLLGPLADNGGPTATRTLLPGSPAIDAGESACPGPDGVVLVDQRGPGFPRPLPGAPGAPGRCDLGAVEVPEAHAAAATAAALAALALALARRASAQRQPITS